MDTIYDLQAGSTKLKMPNILLLTFQKNNKVPQVKKNDVILPAPER